MTTEPRFAEPQRPPIRQRTTVASDRTHTFAVFTRRLAEWWPLVPGGYLGGSFSAGWSAIFNAFQQALAGPADDHDLTKVGGEPTARDAE